MPAFLLSPLFLRAAGALLLALTLLGGWTWLKAHYREEGRVEVRAEAQALAEANRVEAAKASTELAAKHAASEATLRRRIAAIRAAKADACAKANALPEILEGIPSDP